MQSGWCYIGVEREEVRVVVMDLVELGTLGEFIVRDVQRSPGSYALSVKTDSTDKDESVTTYRIVLSRDGWCLRGTTKCFRTLYQVIAHYSRENSKAIGTRLKNIDQEPRTKKGHQTSVDGAKKLSSEFLLRQAHKLRQAQAKRQQAEEQRLRAMITAEERATMRKEIEDEMSQERQTFLYEEKQRLHAKNEADEGARLATIEAAAIRMAMSNAESSKQRKAREKAEIQAEFEAQRRSEAEKEANAAREAAEEARAHAAEREAMLAAKEAESLAQREQLEATQLAMEMAMMKAQDDARDNESERKKSEMEIHERYRHASYAREQVLRQTCSFLANCTCPECKPELHNKTTRNTSDKGVPKRRLFDIGAM